MLESPLAVSLESRQLPYIAFDLSVERIKNARTAGFNVVYGNGSSAVNRFSGTIERFDIC